MHVRSYNLVGEFTDNGAIIFRRNSYDPIYTMPYPLSSFNSYDYYTPPMIAIYDFQANPYQDADFKAKLESEINKYSLPISNFKALWAIKITWDRVLPYPAYFFNAAETSTYQAVLVTDGIFSFCLMRYADGGMKWNYYSIPSNYLPKMGYYSGDYYYGRPNFPAFNDPQTEYYTSIQQRYTPDQYRGYNTNKKGYWAYRLEDNKAYTVNSKQQCLSWYYNERNVFPYWMYNSRPCPCSYWQAIFDSSYRRASDLQYYGIPQKNTDWYSQYYSFQTAFSTWFGGGTRCYYNYWGSLSYGEKERYLPTPWEYENSWFRWYNPYYYYNWYYSYYLSQLQTIRSQYKANEVDPYNNCCRYSGSSYLCNLYRERRPYDFCFGYIPPRFGWLFGDPHISTLDSVQYTFNGLGEFTLANVRDENNTLIFTLQGRTAKAGNGTQATNFIGLVANIQNQTTVEWLLQGSNTTIVRINGTTFTLPDNSTHLDKVSLEKTENNEIQASFDGGISVTVSAKVGALSFTTMLDVIYKNKTEGLLGVFNDDKTDDLMAANGTKLEYDGVKLPNESLIFEIGKTWRTTPSSSLFIYNVTEGETWDTYNNNSFVPLFYDELLLTSDRDLIEQANATCKGNDECIFDILSTKSFEVGEATLGSVKAAEEQQSTMNNFPPNVTGPTTLKTKLYEPVTVSYTATDDNNDTVVFSLQTDSSDINITEGGLLVWLPTSSSPVNVSVIANDSKVATNVVLTLVLCNCTKNGSCVYDSPLSLGNETTNFMVAGCNCSAAWVGMYCEKDFNACEQNQCFDNNTCVDNIAPETGFKCGPCPPTLTGDGVTCTGKDIHLYILCININECAENSTVCPGESLCINTNGSYGCVCLQGFGGANCSDIDECLDNSTICPSNSTCHNVIGSYNCKCEVGFGGENCTDLDECSLGTINCTWADCVNTVGSYICTCRNGYTGNGVECVDIDECQTNGSICGAHASCNNTIGSYECSCFDGFYSVNGTCEDINECLPGALNNCSVHAICTNVAGSYVCDCMVNYTGDGVSCTDIDECSNATSPCAANATCTNLLGNYSCHCMPGYEGDGYHQCNGKYNSYYKPNNCNYNNSKDIICYHQYHNYSKYNNHYHEYKCTHRKLCMAIPTSDDLPALYSEVQRLTVALFEYGPSAGDIAYAQRGTDFTSPLFQPLIGFPFGNQIRKFLYYTDNGHIIFPLSRNDIFSYPNPPVNGFDVDCFLPSIAVFWNDADFSKGVGNTYFQEYQSRNNSVVQRVEGLIKNYTSASYNAQWTLKITWENAPAYPATENDNKTSTYQAVLTTDGSVSYVLMLYKDGGMNWDLTMRYPKPLMGYCSGNMDGFFRSTFIENNSVLRGLTLYNLNSKPLNNNRITCLNWYNNQPTPSSWNAALLSCPCLYRQGISDFRYRTTKAGGSSMTTLLRSTFSNRHNAGVRCVYYRRNQFLEGFQERTWISPYVKPDAELDAYDICCNQVDDPQFCSMYMQRRPSINCRTYRPLFPGWMFGDPHITTLDGFSYTFNGLGDFTLVHASDGDITFTLQGRTEQTGTAQATNFKAFAVKYSSSTADVTVEWYLGSDNSTYTLVNGQNVSFSYSGDIDADINNSNVGVFFLKNDSITATFEGVLSVSVSQYFGMLTAVSSLPSQFINKTKGLLGTWNNDQSDDFMRPNGTTIPSNSSEADKYTYGLLWEVKDNNLFSTQQINGRSYFTPVFLSDLETQFPDQYAALQSTCNSKLECIYDAMSTNNTELGKATLTVADTLQKINDTLNAIPPYIIGSTTIQTFINTSIMVNYSSNGTDVIFSTDTNTNPDIVLSNGSLTWNPTSTAGFIFNLIATDSKGYSSSLQPSFVICNCALIAGCVCKNNYTGEFCENPPDLCAQGCYPNVTCSNTTVDRRCGPCPSGLTGDGLHCTGNGTSCSCSECDSSYCNNRGTCTKSLPSCTPVCQCHDAYTGLNCATPKDRYPAQLNAMNVNELAKYASCEPGFKLNNETLDCGYKCASYCMNDGTCKVVDDNPTCSCKPFTIYTTSGERCENLSMNLNAFFGILFGSLAFLFLLILGIVLGIYFYRKRKSKNDYDDTDELYQTQFNWKSSFLPSFTRLGDKEIPSLNTDTTPNLINWKPHLEKVDSTAEVKIKRPEMKPEVSVHKYE
ncbi:PREDICTED: mucin-4 [Nanorana parkeri]|uniref:mucin-4 n=1 Tax=Nanorana parkeri TaxID=125878 RepID=UPI0008550840|nr:PREDICTED: mucin-4 [Nanorana parkeri]